MLSQYLVCSMKCTTSPPMFKCAPGRLPLSPWKAARKVGQAADFAEVLTRNGTPVAGYIAFQSISFTFQVNFFECFSRDFFWGQNQPCLIRRKLYNNTQRWYVAMRRYTGRQRESPCWALRTCTSLGASRRVGTLFLLFRQYLCFSDISSVFFFDTSRFFVIRLSW
jgi:hypothetical protein